MTAQIVPDSQHSGLVGVLPQPLRDYAQLARFDRPIGWWLLFWPCAWGVLLAGGMPTLRSGCGSTPTRPLCCESGTIWAVISSHVQNAWTAWTTVQATKKLGARKPSKFAGAS
jgi:hypothetical protein